MSSHEHVFAVFDISSSSVAGAHVLSRADTCPNALILTSVRIDAVVTDDINIQRFITQANRSLEQVISTIRAQDVHKPSHIQISLASPWYSTETRIISYRSEKPFICTKKLVESLVDAEIADIKKTDGPFGSYGKESVIIEKQLSGIKLNGYLTHEPYDKKATELQCTLTVTIAPKKVLDLFSDTLRRSYGARPIRFTTGAFTAFIVARDRLPIEEACMIVDVGEEVTDVAFVTAGMLAYQHSFPVGTFGLYRALAKEGGDMVTESKALLEAYRINKVAPQTKKRIERAILAYSKEWQKGLQQVLETGHYGWRVPHQILLMVNERFETIMTSVLVKDPIIKHSCGAVEPRITYIDESTLGTAIGTVSHEHIDIPIATTALFAQRLV